MKLAYKRRAFQLRTNPSCKADCVYTPPDLAKKIVKHFKPMGRCLEPCYGKGAFYNLMKFCEWDEIEMERNFFDRIGNFKWIITNPPWSQLSAFLAHAFTVADNVVMLIHVQQAFMPNRLRMAKFHKFGLKEIVLLDTPANFPSGGFQLGAVHWRKGYNGPMTITDKQRKKFHNGRGKKSSRLYVPKKRVNKLVK